MECNMIFQLKFHEGFFTVWYFKNCGFTEQGRSLLWTVYLLYSPRDKPFRPQKCVPGKLSWKGALSSFFSGLEHPRRRQSGARTEVLRIILICRNVGGVGSGRIVPWMNIFHAQMCIYIRKRYWTLFKEQSPSKCYWILLVSLVYEVS